MKVAGTGGPGIHICGSLSSNPQLTQAAAILNRKGEAHER
jgi:hypothetical protein